MAITSCEVCKKLRYDGQLAVAEKDFTPQHTTYPGHKLCRGWVIKRVHYCKFNSRCKKTAERWVQTLEGGPLHDSE